MFIMAADLPSLTLSTSDLSGLMDFMLDHRQANPVSPGSGTNAPLAYNSRYLPSKYSLKLGYCP